MEVKKELLVSIASTFGVQILSNKRLIRNKKAAFNKAQEKTMEETNNHMFILIKAIQTIIDLEVDLKVRPTSKARKKASETVG